VSSPDPEFLKVLLVLRKLSDGDQAVVFNYLQKLQDQTNAAVNLAREIRIHVERAVYPDQEQMGR